MRGAVLRVCVAAMFVVVVGCDSAATATAGPTVGEACGSDPSKSPACLSPANCVPTTRGGTAGVCTLATAG